MKGLGIRTVAAIMLLACSHVNAATLTWDSDRNTANGVTPGAGTWGAAGANTNWFDGLTLIGRVDQASDHDYRWFGRLTSTATVNGATLRIAGGNQNSRAATFFIGDNGGTFDLSVNLPTSSTLLGGVGTLTKVGAAG